MGDSAPALAKPKLAPLAKVPATSTFLPRPRAKQYSPAARSSQQKGFGARNRGASSPTRVMGPQVAVAKKVIQQA